MSEYPLEPGTPPASSGLPPEMPPVAILTPVAQEYLGQTRPWVRFISVLVFVGSGFMVIAGLAMLALGMAGGFAGRDTSAVFGAAWGALVGSVYLLMACLYIAPGVFLHRYAGAIGQLIATGASSDLEDAIKHQRSFWRFVGVLSVVAIIVSIFFIGLAVVLGVMGAVISGRR
jgi:hypothetical protein